MRAAWYSEIDKFPAAVLAHHYPETRNYGDFTAIRTLAKVAPVDVLVGGTPCQSFSVAGLRGGLSDDRGNLCLEFLRLAGHLKPRWIIWENVPGVRISNKGRDFGTFLGALGQLGYGWAYRSLDAQYFRLAQRRQRVFVVGYLGDWRPAGAVLFDADCLSGNPAPSREAREGVAGTIAGGARKRGGYSTDDVPVVSALTTRAYADNESQESRLIAHTLRGNGFDASEDGTGRGTPLVVSNAEGSTGLPFLTRSNIGKCVNNQTPLIAYAIQERAVSENITNGPQGKGYQPDIAYTLEARHHVQAVAYRTAGDGCVYEEGDITAPLTTGTDRSANVLCFDTTQITNPTNQSNPKPGGPCHTINGTAHPPAIAHQMRVRRLTPRECERLMGFPDDWTLIPWRKKPAEQCPDGPRYKAIGNSMAVTCMRWIGRRLLAVNEVVA